MNNNNNLSPGFIPVEKACEIIKANTREDPDVDMDYLISRRGWIETRHNFRLPRIKRLSPDKIRRTKRGTIIEYENNGEYNVYIETNYQKELLKETISAKYRELVGRDYQDIGLKARSTVADDAQGKAAVQPRNNAKPIAKEGAYIGGGETITSNGDGLLS